jgi:hypothetical protein
MIVNISYSNSIRFTPDQSTQNPLNANSFIISATWSLTGGNYHQFEAQIGVDPHSCGNPTTFEEWLDGRRLDQQTTDATRNAIDVIEPVAGGHRLTLKMFITANQCDSRIWGGAQLT